MEIQLIIIMMNNTKHLNLEPSWISLMDYAVKKGISLSTLRRHIKANKLTYKVENGRYLLWDGKTLEQAHSSLPSEASHSVQMQQIQNLQIELLKAREEIAELKTLIALYEEKFFDERLNN